MLPRCCALLAKFVTKSEVFPLQPKMFSELREMMETRGSVSEDKCSQLHDMFERVEAPHSEHTLH